MTLLPFLLGALVSGPQLEHCRLGGVLFTSPSTGLAFDACGALFETRDGGATWAKGTSPVPGAGEFQRSLSLGAVLSDGSVLLGGYIGGQVLRSTDKGSTWASVALPEGQWFYALSSAGPHVWMCGSSGHVVHSDDSGKRWSDARSSPTNGDDRCISLSFLDGKRGWVAGWYGHLFETGDGGATWSALQLPAAFKIEGQHPRTIDAVLRVDAQVGFVAGAPGTFRTTDGGKTWVRLEIPPESALKPVSLPDGRRLLVTERSARAGQAGWEPRLDLVAVARGPATVALEGELLGSWEPTGAKRIGRLTSAPSGEVPRLESVRTLGSVRSGFDRKRAFRSDDGQQTWVELAPLPGEATFTEVAFVNARTLLARAEGGALFRSADEGRHWRESQNVTLDSFDLARVTGATPVEPLSCLSQPAGSATLEFGARGCFGGSQSVVLLEWNAAGATVRTTLDAVMEPKASRRGLRGRTEATAETARMDPAPLALSAAEAKKRLGELVLLATRPEEPSGCSSTTGYFAKIEVSCLVKGVESKETLQLESYDCNQREGLAPGVGGSTSSGGGPAGYARAIGVYNWALGLTAAESNDAGR